MEEAFLDGLGIGPENNASFKYLNTF